MCIRDRKKGAAAGESIEADAEESQQRSAAISNKENIEEPVQHGATAAPAEAVCAPAATADGISVFLADPDNTPSKARPDSARQAGSRFTVASAIAALQALQGVLPPDTPVTISLG